MFGALPGWLEGWGKDLILLAAIAGAVGVLTKTPFVRWVWRVLVHDPLWNWGRSVVGSVVDEKVVQPNGGSSLRDAVDALSSQQVVLLEWTAEQAERQSEWAEYVDAKFSEVNERMDRLCAEVKDSKTGRKGAA